LTFKKKNSGLSLESVRGAQLLKP